jgi:antitoxin MazE
MQTRIQKWGNSLALRIPKSFAVQTQIEQNTLVDVSLQDGKLVIAPVKPTWTLEELLAQVTEDNLHGEQDFGEAVGGESW